MSERGLLEIPIDTHPSKKYNVQKKHKICGTLCFEEAYKRVRHNIYTVQIVFGATLSLLIRCIGRHPIAPLAQAR